MRMPSEAPFLSAAFSLRRRSSSAFISSSGMAFSFSLAQFYHAVLAVQKQIATKRLRLHGAKNRRPDRAHACLSSRSLNQLALASSISHSSAIRLRGSYLGTHAPPRDRSTPAGPLAG